MVPAASLPRHLLSVAASFAIWSMVVAAFGYAFVRPQGADDHSDYTVEVAILLTIAIPLCGWPAVSHSRFAFRHRLVQALWLTTLIAIAALGAQASLIAEPAASLWAGGTLCVYAAITLCLSCATAAAALRAPSG